jgi:AcrR family transcriptional regulator
MSSKGERTRARILDVAAKVLTERGPAHVRMEDIALAADLTRQALYLHFPSRTELFLALIDHRHQELQIDRLFDAVRAAERPRDALRLALVAHGKLASMIHDVIVGLDSARATDAAAAAAWDDRMAVRRKGFGGVVARLAAAGDLARGWSAEEIVDALVTLVAPRVFQELVRERGWSIERYEKFLVAASHGFLRPESPTNAPRATRAAPRKRVRRSR